MLQANADGTYTVRDITGDVTLVVTGVADCTAPQIAGVTDGQTYFAPQTVYVSDPNLASVTVNGMAVMLDAQGALVLDPNVWEGEYTIVATDEAGNRTEVTVTVYRPAAPTPTPAPEPTPAPDDPPAPETTPTPAPTPTRCV